MRGQLMKRNLDLIRDLLLKLESLPTEMGAVYSYEASDPLLSIEGHSEHEIYYHLDLLRERGLIESPGSQPMLGITFERLTWEGHDYLDAVRDPEIWKKTKQGAEAAGSFTFDIVKELAKALIKAQIAKHTGMTL